MIAIIILFWVISAIVGMAIVYKVDDEVTLDCMFLMLLCGPFMAGYAACCIGSEIVVFKKKDKQ